MNKQATHFIEVYGQVGQPYIEITPVLPIEHLEFMLGETSGSRTLYTIAVFKIYPHQ